MTLINIYINILIILPFMILLFIVIHPSVKALGHIVRGGVSIKPEKTYTIVSKKYGNSITYGMTCLKCNRTSYHPKDVEYLYCANCGKFHRRF